MFKKIMIATDGSELGKKAVSAGIALAKELGAELFIVRVVPRYAITYFEGAIALAAVQIASIESQWQHDAAQLVALDCETAKAQGLRAKALVIKSDAIAEALIKACIENGCELIVMASHGHKAIKRLLLGSETLNVLTHSHTAVLVVR